MTPIIWIQVFTVSRFLGEKNYHFLMDLDTSYEPSADKYTIIDKRIVKNGFNVVIIFNGMKTNDLYNIVKIYYIKCNSNSYR